KLTAPVRLAAALCVPAGGSGREQRLTRRPVDRRTVHAQRHFAVCGLRRPEQCPVARVFTRGDEDSRAREKIEQIACEFLNRRLQTTMVTDAPYHLDDKFGIGLPEAAIGAARWRRPG